MFVLGFFPPWINWPKVLLPKNKIRKTLNMNFQSKTHPSTLPFRSAVAELYLPMKRDNSIFLLQSLTPPWSEFRAVFQLDMLCHNNGMTKSLDF